MGKITKTISVEIPDLPPEIIMYILSLPPVKTLIRFKCISKSFLYLILSPQFVKTLNISSNDPNLTHFRLILNSSHHLLQSFSLPSVLSCNPDNALELDYPLKYPNCSVSVIGSLNGLVCIFINHKNVFIWNHSTRARLPDTGLKKLYKPYRIIYGFGFNECIDDYKVVGLIHLVGNKAPYELVVRVYSLKDDSWKIISDFPSGFLWYGPGKFFNGSLHWIMSEGFSSEFPWVIVSLDLSSEKCGEMEQPNYGTKCSFFSRCFTRVFLKVLFRFVDYEGVWS